MALAVAAAVTVMAMAVATLKVAVDMTTAATITLTKVVGKGVAKVRANEADSVVPATTTRTAKTLKIIHVPKGKLDRATRILTPTIPTHLRIERSRRLSLPDTKLATARVPTAPVESTAS